MHAFAVLYVVAGLVHDGHFANGRNRCSALCAIKHRPHAPSPVAQNRPARTFHARGFPCLRLKMRMNGVRLGLLQAPCRRCSADLLALATKWKPQVTSPHTWPDWHASPLLHRLAG